MGNGVVARNQGYAYGGMKEAFRLNSYAGLTYREGVNVTVTTADVTGSTGIYALSGATNNGSGIQYYGSYLRTPTGFVRRAVAFRPFKALRLAAVLLVLRSPWLT